MNEFWRKLLDIVGGNSYVAMFADPNREILNIDNYAYVVENDATTPVNLATVREFNVDIDSNSDFVLLEIAACAILNGETTPRLNPAILTQIIDRSSARTFFNTPTMLPHIAGFAGFPFLLTSPRVIKARSTLTITAQAAQNVTFSGFFMALRGARIYYKN